MKKLDKRRYFENSVRQYGKKVKLAQDSDSRVELIPLVRGLSNSSYNGSVKFYLTIKSQEKHQRGWVMLIKKKQAFPL